MRIVFLAVDDEFAGAMQKSVYETHPEWVVGSVLSTTALYKKNRTQAGLFVLKTSGLIFLLEMFRMKILRKLFGGAGKITPLELANKHGVEVFHSPNINRSESLDRLAAWNPDLVISTNFSHYIGKKARAVARHGTWNLHKSHLPHYRGMAPSFHALREGATEVGATLHLVDQGFDTGDILQQIAISIEPVDSVYSLNQKASESGGEMMAAFLSGLSLDSLSATPQPAGDWPTHTYPSRVQVREFRAKGCTF